MRMRTALAAALLVTGLGFAAGCASSQEKGGGEPMSAAPPGGAPPGMQMTPEQQAEMEAWTKAGTPGEPHRKMMERVGNWDVAAKSWMEPGAPPMESKGSATFRSLYGGRYLVQEYGGDMMGMPFEGMGIEAYDNVTKEYVSTWIDSMSTGLMVLKGGMDERGVITCSGQMTDPMGGSCTMRCAVTDKDKDTFVMEMWGTDRRSPTERKMMELTYTRRK